MKVFARLFMAGVFILVSSIVFAASLEETRKAAEQGNADAKAKLDSLPRQESASLGERVLSFDVTAALQADASMIVTERIRVNIAHKIIRRGITHAYPLKEKLAGRKMRHYEFTLRSVKLDGKPVPYHTTIGASGMRHGMAIGSADKLAPLGEHTYEIVYKTTGHVRFGQERDEIFYNVMNPDWKFPVDRVSFTLQLPSGGEEAFVDAVAYTGARGVRGSDYTVEGTNTVRTTRTLKPGEGLTVALAWKKGLVAQPEENLSNSIGANRELVLSGIFAILLLFYALARFWSLRGSKGVVIPLFSPPEGMSPGYAAALHSMSYEGRLLHADILWAAVNGFVRLDARDEKKILLSKAEAEGPKRLKSGGEWAYEQCRELVARLFPESLQEVDLRSQDGRTVVADSFGYLKGTYIAQQRGFWQRSYGATIFGVIVFLVLYGMVLPDIYSPMIDLDYEPFAFLCIYGMMVVLVGLCVFGAIRAVRNFTGGRRIAGLILGSLTGIGILAALWAMSADDYFFMAVFAATLGVVAWGVLGMRTRPTPKGRERHLQVKGLEMYIRTAETRRLAMINAPEDTVEKFEELLPYAVALGCADAWQKRFDRVLLAENYTPVWAETDDDSYSTVLTFVATGSDGMAAAVEAAKSARSDGDSGSDSGGDSGFSNDSSTGGGSGGSSVGGW